MPLRLSRPTALAAVLLAPLLALTGCGGDDESTAAVATSASTATSATTGVATPGPSAVPGLDPNGELASRAAALGAAFSDGDYGTVWDLACPGARNDASRDEYATTMAAALEVTLTNPTILDDPLADEARAELAQPGIAHGDDRLVRFDVGPGSSYPNPTMTAWFVSTDSGWLYCGMVPDA